MAVSKHSFTLSKYNEAFKKLELLQADVHQNEGANLLMNKLRGQLKDEEATLLKAEDSVDVVDAMHVEELKNTVGRLSLTLQTLQVVVEEKAPLDAMASALKERDFTQEVEECAQVRVDFVRSMQVKRSTVLLSAPPPKVPPVDMGTLPLDKVCSACGLMMYDDDALGMFLLPCNHAFHMYCFGHLVARKYTCMEMGCMQLILHTMRSLVILGSTNANFQGVQSKTKPSSVPLSMDHEADPYIEVKFFGGNKCGDQDSKVLGHAEKEDVLDKDAATSNIDNHDHIISMIEKSTMKDPPDVDTSFRVEGQVPCTSNIEDQEDKNIEFFVLNKGGDASCAGGAHEDMEIINEKSEPPQENGDAPMNASLDASEDAICEGGAGGVGEDTAEPPQENDDASMDASVDASCKGGAVVQVRTRLNHLRIMVILLWM
ncbi:hypothetical protein L7F22_016364 [Adiantum nelumboides]|nr:hypothetical protein [Adiantum nelumboides]